MLHAWLEPAWRRLIALDDRLPHALLFVGPSGLGKRELAELFAAHLLCAAPDQTGFACEHCTACLLRLSGNHPDLKSLVPAADLATESAGLTESGADGTPAKAASAQIVIEQVRALQKTLAVTGHQSSRRVVIVDPAEEMNAFTANALLKLLEEPPQGCVFLLVSSAPGRLLPTIRSRCQRWSFSRAIVDASVRPQDERLAALVAVCGGMPLAAERLAARGGVAMLTRFINDVAGLSAGGELGLAGRWDSWLKSKEAIAAGFGMVELADWMQRWVTDLATLRLGGQVRFFPAQAQVLGVLAGQVSVAQATNCYNELIGIRRVARHPLNSRLLIEDMLLRYARILGPQA